MNEQSESTDRRAAFNHWNEIVGLGSFDRPPQIQTIGLEHQTRFRNHHPANTIVLSHVQYDFFVCHHVMVQRQVTTIRVEIVRIERVNLNVRAHSSLDFVAGEDH